MRAPRPPLPLLLLLALAGATPAAQALLPALEGEACGDDAALAAPLATLAGADRCGPRNPGFEVCTGCAWDEDALPDFWSWYMRDPSESARWSGESYRGASSLELTCWGGGILSNAFTVRPGEEVALTIWTRREAGMEGPRFWLSIAYLDADGEIIAAPWETKRMTYDWSSHTMTSVAPADTRTARVVLDCWGGTTFFDEVSVGVGASCARAAQASTCFSDAQRGHAGCQTDASTSTGATRAHADADVAAARVDGERACSREGRASAAETRVGAGAAGREAALTHATRSGSAGSSGWLAVSAGGAGFSSEAPLLGPGWFWWGRVLP